MESYRSILDSTPRNASGDGSISAENMAAMQRNATYGMQSLDAALKQVRSESPATPAPLPSPVSATPTMNVVHDVQTSINASATSSSLAGAVSVTRTAKEAAVTSTPSSSSSKTNKSPKTSRDIGIRVIEDGPMKKEGKEGGGKSGDRKRQVGLFYLNFKHFIFTG